MSAGRLRILALGVAALAVVAARYLPERVLDASLRGARVTFLVGALATALAIAVGVLYGVLAANLGARVGHGMMRVCDILDALPTTLVLVVVLVLGRASVPSGDLLGAVELDPRLALAIAIGVVHWTTLARAVRAQLDELRHSAFVDAARAFGVSRARVLAPGRHRSCQERRSTRM